MKELITMLFRQNKKILIEIDRGYEMLRSFLCIEMYFYEKILDSKMIDAGWDGGSRYEPLVKSIVSIRRVIY